MTEAYRHDEIAKLAYELWERRGRPLGSPEIDWDAGESALGVRDSQVQFSLLSVRLEHPPRELGTLSSAAFDTTNFDQLNKFFDGLP